MENGNTRKWIFYSLSEVERLLCEFCSWIVWPQQTNLTGGGGTNRQVKEKDVNIYGFGDVFLGLPLFFVPTVSGVFELGWPEWKWMVKDANYRFSTVFPLFKRSMYRDILRAYRVQQKVLSYFTTVLT